MKTDKTRTVADLDADPAAGDLFWPAEDPESPVEDPEDYAHDAGYGCVVKVLRAVELRPVFVAVLPAAEGAEDDDDREMISTDEDEVNAWVEANASRAEA